METLRKINKTTFSRSNRLELLALRLLFVGYFGYLTLLLLTPNPFRLVPYSTSAEHFLNLLYPWAHGISFTLLTVFGLIAFRSYATSAIGLGLAGYAAATELLQKFIPSRTPEWQDWFQDLAGIALGILLMWMLGVVWRMLRGAKEERVPEIAPSMETVL